MLIPNKLNLPHGRLSKDGLFTMLSLMDGPASD